MLQQINSFLQEHAMALGILTIVIAAARMVYDYFQSRKERKKWRELPMIKWNDQGMALITDTAITTTPHTTHHLDAFHNAFPSELMGFIAALTPNELSTILLEMQTHTNDFGNEKRKDVMRAVTISAARYGFHIPIALVCLDARTHALHTLLRNQMDMCKVSMELICNMGMPCPHEKYINGVVLAGQVLMHYAAKGPYPSVNNFVKTFNKNVKSREKFHADTVKAMVTVYAAMTGMPMPRDYHKYDELTDALYYSGKIGQAVEETKPHLTLVK